ncbi:hypothetical protein MJA45_03145 [Paenibacillus aurantius]|uniref:Uncharacterized protein n=1 Tax=Paenibacillus aurantius TaxID=2918900 RepID=A0AA96RG90_9BACL|nr:hypothetical protein [Paenibacillus aurantius]WNQ12073.1 hypothetical protein MJA45_03145 [Paenibacillus aurantius]
MKKNHNCTDADLQNFIDFKQEVEVWIAGELDGVGEVIGYTENTVKMKDGLYLRGNCYFKVKNC